MSTSRLTRRSFLVATALVVAAAATGSFARGDLAASSTPNLRRIHLQPLGTGIARVDAESVARMVRAVYGIPVDTLAAVPLPSRAFHAPRHRYRADRLLDILGSQVPSADAMVLGITRVDVSATKGDIADWGVLGLARVPGNAAIVSSFRCAKGARDAAHVRERFAKVAVHETGHCLGLHHCPTPGCVMQDVEGRIATIDASRGLCDRCRALLAALGVRVPPARSDA